MFRFGREPFGNGVRDWTIWGVLSNGPAMSPVVVNQPMGHTAYHHVGLGAGAGTGGGPRRALGVAAESRSLGSADLVESGLERGGPYLPWPVLQQTVLHQSHSPYVPTGDWPLIRPAGYEPDDRRGDGALGLSDNEKRLGMVLAVGVGAWLLYKHMGKAGRPGSRRLSRATRRYHARQNPVPFRYEVVASTKRRGRRRYGAIGFTTKRAATDYADDLRKGGHKARVRKKR